MHWITIIVIGIAANLDNLGISLAYGVKQTKIPISSNIIIALISAIVTYIAVIAGGTIIEYISPSTASLLGSLLLCAIGLWTLLSNLFSKQESLKNPDLIDKDKNHIISSREAITLGFILSANCLAGGIGIGANGISATWTVISIGLFSILTVGIGSHFGYMLTKTFIGKYSNYISGFMLILIGIYEIFA
ncbi:sporulation membrane protein YtaF [Cohnella abietis]|uniref:Sporulation membrane protein YtaF n=2 Tax=Cohnella abietis TaxID=2507935 RepID=A0A3T1D9A2_9BACL|nr:sporulation membrane protein YtaF [Cohnella abietis]